MTETITTPATKRYAVVTGGNRGIGFGICRQLASSGIMVAIGDRDEERGLEAIEKLKESGLSDNVVFHLLDVLDPASIASFAAFIKTQFGKLDILVNNAGITGTIIDGDAVRAAINDDPSRGAQAFWNNMTQTFEVAEECLKTNYYGTKRMSEALIFLLQLSDRPRIVNISSSNSNLKNIRNEWARGVLGDVEDLTKEKVDEVLNVYLKDFKEGLLESKGWPTFMSAYTVSKAAVNAYTRILAKKHPTFCINCVSPGFVKTDMNFHTGSITIEEGAESPVRLALLPDGGPSGLFFVQKEVSSFE